MRKKEELIKACKEWFRRSDRPTTMATFKHAVEWADEHPKSPWISVKEKLPKEDVDVIIHTRFQGVFVGNFRGLASDNNPIWEVSNHNGYYYDIYDVDYWIFTPEPQKGGLQ